MTGILKFGVALPFAVFTIVAFALGVAGAVDWAPAAAAAFLCYVPALIAWRFSRSRSRAQRRRAELDAIAIHSGRRQSPGVHSRRAA